MRFLITGGSGFIGTHLTRDLAVAGHEVRILDVCASREYPSLWVKGDVRDKEALRQAVEAVDVVFHLAAEHRDDVQPISLYDEVNVQGARNLVASVEQAGCRRIVFTSSVAVYPLGLPNPDEETVPKPFNPYGESKLSAEKVFLDWANRTPGSTLVIIRPCVIFGPANRGNVYNLIDQIRRGRFLMVGKGDNRKSMAYVGNISQFVAWCLDLPQGVHLFNYADKPDMSVSDIVRTVNRALGHRPSLRERTRVPYWAGLTVGWGFDLLARITRRKLPLSSIRIRKFCAETTVGTPRLESSGFRRPYSLESALEQWVRQEFPGQSQSDR